MPESSKQGDSTQHLQSLGSPSTSTSSRTTGDDVSLGSSNAGSTVQFPVETVKEKKKLRPRHEPVGACTRLGRGIRGLWKTTATESIDKEEDRDLYVRMTLRELGIYLIFLTILCVMAFCMLDPSMFQFTKVMMRLFVDNPSLSGINTDKGFWEYVENDLVNGLYWEKYYNGKDVHHSEEGYIYFENKVMGRAQLRQLRVREHSCYKHPIWDDHIDNCFGHYSSENEDKTRFGITNNTEYNNTAWIYRSSEELKQGSFVGRLTEYDGGGYTRLLGENAKESKERVTDLKEKLWIDRGTRAVFVEFSVYNANLNLFCLATILFEFPTTGAVTTIYRFSTLKLLRYVTTMDYFVMACEGFFLLFLLYYTIEEIIEVKLHGLKHFKSFWNCYDIMMLIFGFGCLACNMYRTLEVSKILKSILQNRDDFSNFSLISYWQEKFNDIIAVTIFFSWMKVFKYISFNQTMAELESTLITCAKDVAGFCVMFFLIFFAYAQWGYSIFGAQIRDFSTIGNCMLTLFRIILGDFNFSEMQSAKPFFGPFFFISYIFMVFFVLLNMFLAIVNDTYCEVKEELDEEFQPFDVGAYFKSGAKKIMKNLSTNYANVIDMTDLLKNADMDGNDEIDFEEWRAYMKKRGHADQEIEGLFAKYDKDGDRVLNADEIEKMQDELEGDEEELRNDMKDVEKAQESAEKMFSKLMLRDEYDDEESSEEEEDSDNEAEERYITGDEFRSMLKRVDNVENSVSSIVSKIQAVLVKLETMERAKVKRRETMSRLIDSVSEFMEEPPHWTSNANLRNRGISAASGRKTGMSKSSMTSVKVESFA